MKIKFKRVFLLSFIRVITTTIPIILACSLTKIKKEDNKNFFSLY